MTKPAANEKPATELVVSRVVVLVECGLPKDTGGSAGAYASFLQGREQKIVSMSCSTYHLVYEAIGLMVVSPFLVTQNFHHFWRYLV